jgi:hypothetical protein
MSRDEIAAWTRVEERETMTSYTITIKSASADMGTHEGATAREAIEAMHRDAGYTSIEAAASALETTVDALVADCEATEVVRYVDGDFPVSDAVDVWVARSLSGHPLDAKSRGQIAIARDRAHVRIGDGPWQVLAEMDLGATREQVLEAVSRGEHAGRILCRDGLITLDAWRAAAEDLA